jgi:hypothetical protein
MKTDSMPTDIPAGKAAPRRVPRPLLATIALGAALLPAAARAADLPRDFAAFQEAVSPQIAAALDWSPRGFRQVEPAIFRLCLAHAPRLDALAPDQRLATILELARFIDRKRDDTAAVPVIAADRDLIGLLDPDRGLDPREITALAAAYDARATVLKQDPAQETIPAVADRFLAAVTTAAREGRPTTVVVLGHGLPEEIQSYSIPFGRLADALVAAPDPAAPASPLDLGRLVLVCDDCYSADFLVNLGGAIESRCRDAGRAIRTLPVMIAGTNHGRVGIADAGEKFVPHFWKDVIELFYVRRPRPAAVTLGDFFEKVDNMMYGYGRAPIVEGGAVTGYRLVNPALCQDPVCFVPLSAEDRDELRRILGLPADAPLAWFLDIG